MVDRASRSFQIPPEFQIYAEKHNLFDRCKWLTEKLLMARPEDPIKYMIDILQRENNDVPRIMLIGPPISGKATLARSICSQFNCVHITTLDLVSRSDLNLRSEAENLLKRGSNLPGPLLVRLLQSRLEAVDCIRKGWLLEGLPNTREQALALQEAGIHVKHVILLEASDNLLIERAHGKRIDPVTGEVYHLSFAPPPDDIVAARLKKPVAEDESTLRKAIDEFRREIVGLIECYKPVLKHVKADQPMAHVVDESVKFVCMKSRSLAPFIPRIVLLGPIGSGKSFQADLLCNKYQVINVDAGQLCREAVSGETPVGVAIRAHVEARSPAPDKFVFQLVHERLTKPDCVTRGWVLHGFPRNVAQAEMLRDSGAEVNRIFFLHVPADIIIERLCYRALDPLTRTQYHLVYNPPKEKQIADRLVKRPADDEKVVRRRLNDYLINVPALTSFYSPPLGQQIDADQDPHTVFESIESRLVNQLPVVPTGSASDFDAAAE